MVTHSWQFRTRFRSGAFGWRSQLPIQRIREAVSEIKKVARRDLVLAGEGAVVFLEKLSPAIEHVDSSSGSIGNAVNRAIEALVPIVVRAPADDETRELWLERLFKAHEDDRIPYIEGLTDSWGELCVTQAIASRWADRLLPTVERLLRRDRDPPSFEFFHGTSACLSALYSAGRFEELEAILEPEGFWAYKRWAMKALIAQGKVERAIELGESNRNQWSNHQDIDSLCEEALLGAGKTERAYREYGLPANQKGTYLAWFRAVAKKYPNRSSKEVLHDLADFTPGEEGKWFAAAKSAGLLEEAIVLARRSPCDPRTLTRASRDFAEKHPQFAADAALAALYWIAAGYGYEIGRGEVHAAYECAVQAAEHEGSRQDILARVRGIAAQDTEMGKFVRESLEQRLR
jgi:hypothetical protein